MEYKIQIRKKFPERLDSWFDDSEFAILENAREYVERCCLPYTSSYYEIRILKIKKLKVIDHWKLSKQYSVDGHHWKKAKI